VTRIRFLAGAVDFNLLHNVWDPSGAHPACCAVDVTTHLPLMPRLRTHLSVCLYMYLRIVARQWLGKNPLNIARERLGKSSLIVARQRLGRNVTEVTNTHELLDASFSMWPLSYQGK
jgi:hypothetical protein